MDILQSRLHNQHLTGEKYNKAEAVVAWLGAVQAQDFIAAKWALGLRLQSASDEIVEKSFNEGRFFRVHVMRPTWHFVLPEDIRWMQELTAPRVKSILGHYNRKLELDDVLFAKTNKILTRALKNRNYLTRQELKQQLDLQGITTNVQRLAHIIMWAELEGLICNGPKKGKQFTYALLEERVPAVKKLTHEESLAKLALTYFTSHGPAQLKDFSWWSGLSTKDAEIALDFVQSKLSKESQDGKTYWFSAQMQVKKSPSSRAFLLSIFDEYIIAYKDRSMISDAQDIERMLSMEAAFTSVIVFDGKVIGGWKRIRKKDSVEIKFNLFNKLNEHATELKEAAASYGTFLGLPVRII